MNSRRQAIVNGDDFGLNRPINMGILRAHAEGILTSCSLLAGAPAAAEAAALALAQPELGVGVHLALVNGRPLLPAGSVPTLVQPDGAFPEAFPRVIAALALGRIDPGEVRSEWAAQIERTLALGIKPTHLDSHQHLHIWPSLLPIAIGLARDYGIQAMRIPGESWLILEPWSGVVRLCQRNALSALSWQARRRARRAGLWCPDHFRGMLAGGRLTQQRLARILANLAPGVTEIMCHPAAAGLETAALGWGYAWERELEALVARELPPLLARHGVELRSFRL